MSTNPLHLPKRARAIVVGIRQVWRCKGCECKLPVPWDNFRVHWISASMLRTIVCINIVEWNIVSIGDTNNNCHSVTTAIVA